MKNLLKWFRPIGNVQKIFLLFSCVAAVILIFLHNPTDGYVAQMYSDRIVSKIKIEDSTGQYVWYNEIEGLRTLSFGDLFDYSGWGFFSKGAVITWLASLKNLLFTLFCVFLIYLISKFIILDDKKSN